MFLIFLDAPIKKSWNLKWTLQEASGKRNEGFPTKNMIILLDDWLNPIGLVVVSYLSRDKEGCTPSSVGPMA